MKDSASVSLQTFIMTEWCRTFWSTVNKPFRMEKKTFFYGGGAAWQPYCTSLRHWNWLTKQCDNRSFGIKHIGRSFNWFLNDDGSDVVVSCWPRWHDRDHRSCRRRRCIWWYAGWTGVASADNNVCVCENTKRKTKTNTYNTMNVDRKRSRWGTRPVVSTPEDSGHCFHFITGRLLLFSPLTSAPYKPDGKYWENRYNKLMFSTIYLSGVVSFKRYVERVFLCYEWMNTTHL